MTSMLPLPPGHPAEPESLRDRVRRGDALLGGIARNRDELALAARAGLDFVAVPPDLTPPPRLPVLSLVTVDALMAVPDDAAGVVVVEGAVPGDAAVLAAAAHDGRAVLVLDAPELAGQPGVDAVVRLVTDPVPARSFVAAGAVVAYDLGAVLDGVAADLAGGRPPAVIDSGREPLVLLSGMLGDASLWDGVAQRLGDVVLPYPVRIDLDDSIDAMAETVLVTAPPRFALVGHSLGAVVALEIMRQAPHRVTRLVLVNASARGPVDAQQQAWSTMRERTLDGRFADVAAELARATLAARRRDDPALVAANEAMARTVGPEGFLRQLAAQSTRPDSRDSVASIAVPVTVLSGADDEICPPALQQELVELCPAAELVTLPGGHMLPLENPAAVAEELRARLVVTAPES